MYDCTEVSPYCLLFFGGDISIQKDNEQETIAVDEWIIFQSPAKIARLVKVTDYRNLQFAYKLACSLSVLLQSFDNIRHFLFYFNRENCIEKLICNFSKLLFEILTDQLVEFFNRISKESHFYLLYSFRIPQHLFTVCNFSNFRT